MSLSAAALFPETGRAAAAAPTNLAATAPAVPLVSVVLAPAVSLAVATLDLNDVGGRGVVDRRACRMSRKRRGL